MSKIIPFELTHLTGLTPVTSRYIHPSSYFLMECSTAFTLMEDKPIACGGFMVNSVNTAVLWSVMSPEAGRHMTTITRAANRLMEAAGVKRIEATVEEGFIPGCRWLSLLGFTLETPKPMRAYGPDGKGHYLYSRVF